MPRRLDQDCRESGLIMAHNQPPFAAFSVDPGQPVSVIAYLIGQHSPLLSQIDYKGLSARRQTRYHSDEGVTLTLIRLQVIVMP